MDESFLIVRKEFIITSQNTKKDIIIGSVTSQDDPIKLIITILNSDGCYVDLDGFKVEVLITYNYKGEKYMIRDLADTSNCDIVYKLYTKKITPADLNNIVSLEFILSSEDKCYNIGLFKLEVVKSMADASSSHVTVNNNTFINYDDMIEDAIEQIKEDIQSGSFDLPIASNKTLGGVIVGDSLSVEENGVINVDYSKLNFSIDNGDLILKID